MCANIESEYIFNVPTPLGFRVRTTRRYWQNLVIMKHEPMLGQEDAVVATLKTPDEVRRSRYDNDIFLFYRLAYPGRWVCVVAKRLNGQGFMLTAYPADYIKQGELMWTR